MSSLQNFLASMISVGADILRSTVSSKTKNVVLQTGDVFTGTVERDDTEHWQQIGFVSRPSTPAAGSAAGQGVILHRADNDVCIATRDTRGQELSGSIGPGETCLYAAGADGSSQGRVLIKDNGNVTLYTARGNVSGGPSVTIQCNADGTINIATNKAAIAIDGSGGITMGNDGGAGFKLGSDGAVTLIGTSIALNGASVSIGANAVTPCVVGPSGITGVGSTSVKVAL